MAEEPVVKAVCGLLVVDKPAGLTSYDCVHRVKQISGDKRVGHCGTLDPLAEGVLLLLIGREATRHQEAFLAMEKQYWFRVQFGIKTDTGDREGKCVQTSAVPTLEAAELAAALSNFKGEHWQTPPRYAALKYKGKPYYHWARCGVEIPRAPRPVQIHSLELLRLDGAFWEGRLVCSRGTYVRTLVEDVAQRVGAVAVLDALARERIGPYRRERALRWDRLLACKKEELLNYCDATVGHHARDF